jgi:outer membrane lipopolysaccharide assembly protein LptE/RlpB
VWAGLLAGLILSGCAGYRLGNTRDLSYRTVAVPVFQNRTLYPQLEAQITSAIRQRLQSDGTLQLETAGTADVVLTGVITKYTRRPVRALKSDTGTPSEYRVTITAQIEARDRANQVVVPATEIEGSADTFIGTDLQSADQQVLPLIAQDLAQRVVTLLAEKW